MVMGWTAALSPAHSASMPSEITSHRGAEQSRQSRRSAKDLPHHRRQNSEFSTLAAMYKNAVPLTVRRPTVAGDRYAVKGVLSS